MQAERTGPLELTNRSEAGPSCPEILGASRLGMRPQDTDISPDWSQSDRKLAGRTTCFMPLFITEYSSR